MSEVVVGVVSGLTVLVLGGALKGAGRWLWAKSIVYSRRVRSAYRGWQWEQDKARVEARLDKVSLLASRQGDFKALHPWRWPEPARRLWHDAAIQLVENGVNWEIEFPEYGAKVRRQGNHMYASWGDFAVDGLPEIRLGSGGYSGYPRNKYWTWGAPLTESA